MGLEAGIRTALAGDAGIAAVVGSRVRPLHLAADDARPYVTYTVTERETFPTLSGEPAEHKAAEWEVGIFADDYDTVVTLSDLIRDRLDQLADTVAGVEFAPCEFRGETDVEEATPEGEESPIYLRVQTYRALYKVSAG
jgi:hypothetical protein